MWPGSWWGTVTSWEKDRAKVSLALDWRPDHEDTWCLGSSPGLPAGLVPHLGQCLLLRGAQIPNSAAHGAPEHKGVRGAGRVCRPGLVACFCPGGVSCWSRPDGRVANVASPAPPWERGVVCRDRPAHPTCGRQVSHRAGAARSRNTEWSSGQPVASTPKPSHPKGS